MTSLDSGPVLSLDGKPKLSLVRGLAMLKPRMLPEEAENLRMGGGTVLAMRWGHRVSTDVDLLLDREMHRPFVLRIRDDLRTELQEMRERREIKKYRISARFAGWEYADSGPISLSASSTQRRCDGTEADTGIALASTEAILTGKLLGRVLVGGQLVARDGYDLCSALTSPNRASFARHSSSMNAPTSARCTAGSGSRIFVLKWCASTRIRALAHFPCRNSQKPGGSPG